MPGHVLEWFRQQIHDETDECLIWPFSVDGHGYGHFQIDGKMWRVTILVCELRYGPKPTPKHEAAHGPCNNPTCFNYRHLSWKTHRENSLDKHRDKTMPSYPGIINPRARLSEEKIIEIRESYHLRGTSRKEIAQQFKIQTDHADKIIHGRLWRHVPMPSTIRTIKNLFA
jgi:HNH endonuclease